MPSGRVALRGHLTVPPDARGLVLFVHGSGSSRHSPRNRFVAERLRHYGLATLLFDLLSSEEEQVDRSTSHFRLDINLQAGRVEDSAAWAASREEFRRMKIGCFGASIGAPARSGRAPPLRRTRDVGPRS